MKFQRTMEVSRRLHDLSNFYYYRIGRKFGGRKVWRIWQILPNRQTSYNSTTIVSILTFSPNFIRQIDCFTFFAKLFSRQTFVLYGISSLA